MEGIDRTKIRAASVCLTGVHHQKAGAPCEDTCFMMETPELCFYGLADGQSGKRFGREGGAACLEVLAEYIREQGIDGLLNRPFPDELPYLFMKQIRERLLTLAREQGGAFTDYASTLLAVAVDPATGRYFFVHIGDGCLIGIRQNGTSVMLSALDNDFLSRYTWLTTSEHGISHLRTGHGSIQNLHRLVLLTDGATALCRGRNIPRRAGELLRCGTQAEILAFLKASQSGDDAGCILLDLAE